jgi:hypothetical protein
MVEDVVRRFRHFREKLSLPLACPARISANVVCAQSGVRRAPNGRPVV